MAQPSDGIGQENLRVRSGDLVAGRYLVTVAGPDGSEVQPCPPSRRPEPRRRPVGRAGLGAGAAAGPGPTPAVGPVALGAAPGDLPLLDRDEQVAQLVGMLSEGRSIRLLGAPGSGRSALLAAVAEAAAGLAPDGVVQLSGYRRTADDLLYDLFAAGYQADGYRPDRASLLELLARVGAVVVIDEVGPDGAELEELLAAAPECAFLISVAPGSGGALPVGSRLEDHLLGGLSREACLALLARLTGRALDEAERSWAVDLWFESQGLPLRFVQAAALLRRRDLEVDTRLAAAEDRGTLFGRPAEPAEPADPAIREAELRATVALPSVAEVAAPALLLTEGLSEEALAVLRLAVAFGGECPTAPHLPALIDVDHGESALRELTECGLAESLGGHHRLTTGVLSALAARWGTDAKITEGAAEHFAWWVGHASVSGAQVAAEAEVLLGALRAERVAGRPAAVLGLARAAAPALALALRWGAWRQVLELGAEQARELGNARDEAWFRHELGVMWLCEEQQEQARTALEAAGRLRSGAGDSRGMLASRRLLTLIQRLEPVSPAAEAQTQAFRRPVIRTLAERSWQSASQSASVLRGWSRRNVLVAAGGLVVLAVVGTTVGVLGGGSPSAPAPAGATVGGGNGASGNPLTGAGAAAATGGATTGSTASGSASAPAPVGAAPSASASGSASQTATEGRSHSATPTAQQTTGGGATAPGTPDQPAPPVAAPTTPSASAPSDPGPAPSSHQASLPASPPQSPTTPSPQPSTTTAKPTPTDTATTTESPS
ncbi:ATP-binding protein [Kitasatospora sp. RB6PN24]|uniref:ATP-binding protein n=1 Tax=Kitasatospora humi TaxID=2893891 RepID=UPI001E6561DB|nr:ATP-binding protein [Kitasatospora humi]MCC9306916.1 ATP-binding protein [Kitasatospora humi]